MTEQKGKPLRMFARSLLLVARRPLFFLYLSHLECCSTSALARPHLNDLALILELPLELVTEWASLGTIRVSRCRMLVHYTLKEERQATYQLCHINSRSATFVTANDDIGNIAPSLPASLPALNNDLTIIMIMMSSSLLPDTLPLSFSFLFHYSGCHLPSVLNV